MLLFLTTSMAAVTSRANKQQNKLEICFRKNLAKLTGSAVRINSKKPKGKKTMKEKKNGSRQKEPSCTPTSSSEKVRPLTTGPYDHCTDNSSKLIVLKYFSLPFTLFEPYGAVFIMNSKIHLRKNSSNEYFKTISHYLRVYSLSGFIQAARLTDWFSSSLLSLKFRSPFFRC